MDAATIAARITATENAIDALMMGQRVVRATGPNGLSVEYGPADLPTLRQYLAWLNSMATSTPRRPLYFEFGR